jgi:hypothetical protein
MSNQLCKICGHFETDALKSIPNAVCSMCTDRAVDSMHNPVIIARQVIRTKTSMELGDIVAYIKTSANQDLETSQINREVTNKRFCFIDGIAVELISDGEVYGLAVALDQNREDFEKARTRKTQPCGVCRQPVIANQRYPNYVCSPCQGRAVDALHRPVITSNTGLLGTGEIALLRHKPEGVEEHVPSDVANENFEIYIDGVKCNFQEARFGGIVVQPV